MILTSESPLSSMGHPFTLSVTSGRTFTKRLFVRDTRITLTLITESFSEHFVVLYVRSSLFMELPWLTPFVNSGPKWLEIFWIRPLVRMLEVKCTSYIFLKFTFTIDIICKKIFLCDLSPGCLHYLQSFVGRSTIGNWSWSKRYDLSSWQ